MATQRRTTRKAQPKTRPHRGKAPVPAVSAPSLLLSLYPGRGNIDLSLLYSRATIQIMFQDFQAEATKMLSRHIGIGLTRELVGSLESPGEVAALQRTVAHHVREFLKASLDFVDAAEARFRTIYDGVAPRKES